MHEALWLRPAQLVTAQLLQHRPEVRFHFGHRPFQGVAQTAAGRLSFAYGPNETLFVTAGRLDEFGHGSDFTSRSPRHPARLPGQGLRTEPPLNPEE
ncbi:hypothetical protein [Deinococcus frigens]|uniref:hypothetical protein n=1 Tax=Deinococcus frigens TaxID=249403 RepID=UPI0039EE34CF